MRQPGSRVVVVTGRALADPPALGVPVAMELPPGVSDLLAVAAPPTGEYVRSTLKRAWYTPAWVPDFDILDFDGGVELRARGRHKGLVVRRVLAESGREALAAYLGDDRTDEDAFAVIRGRGCGVLVRPAWRPSRARVWLRPPDDLTQFLECWRDCGRRLH